jgi:hypothetical protein
VSTTPRARGVDARYSPHRFAYLVVSEIITLCLAACSVSHQGPSHGKAEAGVACTAGAIRAGVRAAEPSLTLDSLQKFACSGRFAYAWATMSAQGNENSITILLLRDGNAWLPADRSTYCTDHSVPSDIYFNACETQ